MKKSGTLMFRVENVKDLKDKKKKTEGFSE